MPRSKAGGSENTGPLKEIPLRPDAARARFVDIDRIAPNPRNLRGVDLWEDDEERDSTVNSMREVGLLQVLLVCTRDAFCREYPSEVPKIGSADFVVMAGHRRLEAAKLAGLTELGVDVQDDKLQHLDLLMLEENLKRKALNVFQEGEGYRRLEAKGASHSQIGKRVSKSKSTITKRIALLALPDEARAAVLDKRLGVDAAYNLLVALDGQADKVLAAADVMREGSLTAQEAVNQLLAGSARTDSPALTPPADPRPDAPETVLAEPLSPKSALEAMPEVPAARAAESVLAEPAAITPAAAVSTLADTNTGPEPVLAEPGQQSTTVAAPPAPVEQEGRAMANAARDQYCRKLVLDYTTPSIDAQTARVAVSALQHASGSALNRAHAWLKQAGLVPAADQTPTSYRDALILRGNSTLIARLAYAVAMAEDELRASNRSRHWDYRDVAYLEHLIDAGYEPAEWEREQRRVLG